MEESKGILECYRAGYSTNGDIFSVYNVEIIITSFVMDFRVAD